MADKYVCENCGKTFRGGPYSPYFPESDCEDDEDGLHTWTKKK